MAATILLTLAAQVHALEVPLLTRVARAAGSAKKPGEFGMICATTLLLTRAALAAADCRYDKGAWEECQANGVQKRVMKLRPGQSATNECEAEKVLTRPCKKGKNR